MTNIDVKTVGELFKSVGPTEEHREKFGQMLPGNLVARAVGVVVSGPADIRASGTVELPAWKHLNKAAKIRCKADTSCLEREAQWRHGSSAAPRGQTNLQGGAQWPPNPLT
jgi:hypothetical protein